MKNNKLKTTQREDVDTVWFPIIDITNYHTLSGFQQYKFII